MGRNFDLDMMRYDRIIITADADVDGSHIRTLLITLFAKVMRPLIEAGRLYSAVPPLYVVKVMGKNPESIYVLNDEELDKTLKRLDKEKRPYKTPVERFKGLGEMQAEDLWDTTLDPEKRVLRRITLEDVERAEKLLELAMGSDVAPRKSWIIDSSDKIDREAIDA